MRHNGRRISANLQSRIHCWWRNLTGGEAAVIALARTLLPCTVIIDEQRGRRIAHQIYGLPVKGTAGLLVEARRHRLIGDLRPMLYQLKAAGYFLADSVIDAACRAAENPD